MTKTLLAIASLFALTTVATPAFARPHHRTHHAARKAHHKTHHKAHAGKRHYHAAATKLQKDA